MEFYQKFVKKIPPGISLKISPKSRLEFPSVQQLHQDFYQKFQQVFYTEIQKKSSEIQLGIPSEIPPDIYF